MKRSAELTRLDRLLEADKEEMIEASRRAALADISRVVREYFEADGEVSMRFGKAKNGTDVTISFHAVRVKNFTALK